MDAPVIEPTLDATRKVRLPLLNQHYLAVLAGPVVVFAIVFLIFPLAGVIVISLHEWELGISSPSLAGLGNYRELLSTARFMNSVRVTLIYASGSVVFQVTGAVLIAQLLQRDFVGKKLVIPIMILPSFATPAALSRLWRYVFHPDAGILNFMLETVGFSASSWIYDSASVIPSLWLYDFWRSTPVGVLFLLGGFAGLPNDVFEAAHIDGANGLQRFFRITLPLLAPILFVVILLSVIDNLKEFGAIWTLTQGGPGQASETLYVYAYKTVYQFGNFGLGSAAGVVLFAIVFVAALAMMRVGRKGYDL